MEYFERIKRYLINGDNCCVKSITDERIIIYSLNTEFMFRYEEINNSIIVSMVYEKWNCAFDVRNLSRFRKAADMIYFLIAHTLSSYLSNVNSREMIEERKRN